MDPSRVRADHEGATRRQSQTVRFGQPGTGTVSSLSNHLEDTYPLPRSLAALTHWGVDLAEAFVFRLAFQVRRGGPGADSTEQQLPGRQQPREPPRLWGWWLTFWAGKGNGLYVLAASDYFFNTKLKRTYCQKCTRLLPMDREVPLHRALPYAEACLAGGKQSAGVPGRNPKPGWGDGTVQAHSRCFFA